jgi:hypothetical protein
VSPPNLSNSVVSAPLIVSVTIVAAALVTIHGYAYTSVLFRYSTYIDKCFPRRESVVSVQSSPVYGPLEVIAATCLRGPDAMYFAVKT